LLRLLVLFELLVLGLLVQLVLALVLCFILSDEWLQLMKLVHR
jgi:hypothetical protein